MHVELDALKATLGEKHQEIAKLREFLRKTLAAMRDIHQVTGSPRLAELITEGDVLLGHE
jgi:hypothetical protein